MTTESDSNRRVFLIIPYEPDYLEQYLAPLTFSILSCGFEPRIAADTRFEDREKRITQRIHTCDLCISDVSPRWVEDGSWIDKTKRVISRHAKLPRYNVPYELGRFTATKKLDDLAPEDAIAPDALILSDSGDQIVRYFSDIRNRGVERYARSVEGLITPVRDWLHEKLLRRDKKHAPKTIALLRNFQAYCDYCRKEGNGGYLLNPDRNYYAVRTDMKAWLTGEAQSARATAQSAGASQPQ